MAASSAVKYALKNGVAVLQITSPPVNALGEEEVLERAGLGRRLERLELAALDLQARRELRAHGGVDAAQDRPRRRQRRPRLERRALRGVAEAVDDDRVRAPGRARRHELDGRGLEAGLRHDDVDGAEGERPLRADRRARQHHLQRRVGADEPRQPLRAACSREEP